MPVRSVVGLPINARRFTADFADASTVQKSHGDACEGCCFFELREALRFPLHFFMLTKWYASKSLYLFQVKKSINEELMNQITAGSASRRTCSSNYNKVKKKKNTHTLPKNACLGISSRRRVQRHAKQFFGGFCAHRGTSRF